MVRTLTTPYRSVSHAPSARASSVTVPVSRGRFAPPAKTSISNTTQIAVTSHASGAAAAIVDQKVGVSGIGRRPQRGSLLVVI